MAGMITVERFMEDLRLYYDGNWTEENIIEDYQLPKNALLTLTKKKREFYRVFPRPLTEKRVFDPEGNVLKSGKERDRLIEAHTLELLQHYSS